MGTEAAPRPVGDQIPARPPSGRRDRDLSTARPTLGAPEQTALSPGPFLQEGRESRPPLSDATQHRQRALGHPVGRSAIRSGGLSPRRYSARAP